MYSDFRRGFSGLRKTFIAWNHHRRTAFFNALSPNIAFSRQEQPWLKYYFPRKQLEVDDYSDFDECTQEEWDNFIED